VHQAEAEEDFLGRVAVAERGGGDHDQQRKAAGLHHQVPLATVDSLRAVVAAGGFADGVCGLPGSGKTTLAMRLAEHVPAVRLCPDEWMTDLGLDLFDEAARDRLERRLSSHAQDLLSLGQSVILEFGFWGRPERDEKRLAARALGVAVELHCLTVSLDELCKRIESRSADGTWGTALVTRKMLEEYAEHFEAPEEDELELFDQSPPGHFRWTLSKRAVSNEVRGETA
jgi:predicted kinase